MRDPQELMDWGKALAILAIVVAVLYFGWQWFVR